VSRLKALLAALGDWAYGWFITLFGQNGEHDGD
jgi:hypothetical protein